MSRAEWQEIVARVAALADSAGLDIVHPFDSAQIDRAALGATPDFELGRPGALGILLGNTRRLWPVFRKACRDRPELARDPHPLDRYVTEQVTQLVLSASPRPLRLIFAHVTKPAPFPIQRLAEQVGLATLSPSHLSIHPTYGPWFALRALVLLEVDGPPGSGAALESPCRACRAPCLSALARARAASGPALDARAIAEHAPLWIAVRDACPVGAASRYGDEQLDYHYRLATEKLAQGS